MVKGTGGMKNSNGGMVADWEDKHGRQFGAETIQLTHRLQETGLFTRSAIADLIDRYPRELYGLNTMGGDASTKEWREGEIGNHSGVDVISAIENGRMWLNLRQLMDVDKNYGEVLKSIFSEFETRLPGLNTYKHSMGLLVSSPNVQVYYHCDVPGQMLWQLEGKKRIYIYPTKETFLPREALESVIIGETEEEIPYQKRFDDFAEIYDLEPGQMLHWPLNGPHRVENKDCLNISVTTEHWTKEIRNSYAVNYANGVLRRSLGYAARSNSPSGAHVYAKAALTLLCKKTGWNKARKFQPFIDFTIDPNMKNGIADIARKPLIYG